jgi:hypothetical protein
MRRLIHTGTIALIASAVFAGCASAATAAAGFGFKYADSYGKRGLSQRYTGPHHHRTELRHRRSDPGQRHHPEGILPSGGKPQHRCGRSSRCFPGGQPYGVGRLLHCEVPEAVLHRAAHQRRKDRYHIR